MKRLSLLLVLLLPLVLAACGEDEVSLDPPEIEYGVDMAEMGMPVTSPKFTVATLPEGETEWLLFDDIGEFLRYYQIKSDDFQVVWIPDVNTEEWVRGEDAWFVQSEHYCNSSPMRWCVAAFKDEESAREAVEEYGGDIYSWDTVFDHTWDSAPVPEGGQ